jgi:hypothetical protein
MFLFLNVTNICKICKQKNKCDWQIMVFYFELDHMYTTDLQENLIAFPLQNSCQSIMYTPQTRYFPSVRHMKSKR